MQTGPLKRQPYGASGIGIIAGLWLMAAPFVLGYAGIEAAKWNDITAGALVLVTALFRSFSPRARPAWSVADLVLGFWLLLAPFVLGYASYGTPLGQDVVMGLTVLLLAWLGLLGNRPIS